MPEFERRLSQLHELRSDILDLREARDESAGVVELDQSRTGRLSRVDSLQRQAIAQHGRRQAQARLRKVEAAILRCVEGTYGYCLECDEAVHERRLDVDPAAELCIDCARGQDTR